MHGKQRCCRQINAAISYERSNFYFNRSSKTVNLAVTLCFARLHSIFFVFPFCSLSRFNRTFVPIYTFQYLISTLTENNMSVFDVEVSIVQIGTFYCSHSDFVIESENKTKPNGMNGQQQIHWVGHLSNERKVAFRSHRCQVICSNPNYTTAHCAQHRQFRVVGCTPPRGYVYFFLAIFLHSLLQELIFQW